MPARTRTTSTNTILSDAERAFLDDHRVARLATADDTGAPHAIPIVYALVDGRIYFVIDEKPKRTRTRLKRLQNIRQNPKVAMLIDDYDDDWSRLAYLLVQGHAEVVTDRDEYTHTLAVLRGRYPQYQHMPLAFDTHPMVRITPERQHLWHSGAAK